MHTAYWIISSKPVQQSESSVLRPAPDLTILIDVLRWKQLSNRSEQPGGAKDSILNARLWEIKYYVYWFILTWHLFEAGVTNDKCHTLFWKTSRTSKQSSSLSQSPCPLSHCLWVIRSINLVFEFFFLSNTLELYIAFPFTGLVELLVQEIQKSSSPAVMIWKKM